MQLESYTRISDANSLDVIISIADEKTCSDRYLNNRITSAALASLFFFGLASYEICLFAVPGFYRSKGDTVHSPYMTDLQIDINKISFLVSSIFMIASGALCLSTICQKEISPQMKKAIAIAVCAGAFFETAPIVIMFA